jgi:cytochrome c oxidase subunit 2
MRRGAILQMLLIALVAAAAGTAIAIFVPWLPRPASKEADRIDFVFWFVVGICIFIFAIVAAMMTYAVTHFRASPDDDSDGPPIHGHTGLEITWTLIPTVLVTAIGVVSAVVLARNDNVGKDPLRIHVTAQQFAWSFSYPSANNMTFAVMRLPVGRSVKLDFTAKDVIHSFWVPEFGQKQDTVPGLHPTLHITPTRTGTFPIICTELCGAGHSLMRSEVIVMPKRAFAHWLAAQKQASSGTGTPTTAGGGASTTPGGVNAGKGTPSGNAQQLGALVFKNNSCGSCHTFTPAGATGKVGPDLDKLPQYAKQAKQPLASFVRTSIVDPSAYIQPGFGNLMPKIFGSMPKPQLDALVQYLISRKG